MNSQELADLIQKISASENLDIKEIAEASGVSRSHLSTVINKNPTVEIEKSSIMLRKLQSRFPSYFGLTHKSNKDNANSIPGDRTSIGIPPSSEKLDSTDRELLQDLLTYQKATIQYLREIQEFFGIGGAAGTGKSADVEVLEAIRKGKSAGKGKQSNNG